MTLSNVSDGLLGAVVTGGFSLLLWWLGRRRQPARHNLWQAQAEALRNELRSFYEEQLAYLRGQLEAANREIARLNRLLNRKRSGHD